MSTTITLGGLGVMTALDAGLVAALAGRLPPADRREQVRAFGIAGLMLFASAVCAVTGGFV